MVATKLVSIDMKTYLIDAGRISLFRTYDYIAFNASIDAIKRIYVHMYVQGQE